MRQRLAGASSSDVAAVGGGGLRHGRRRAQFLSVALRTVGLGCV